MPELGRTGESLPFESVRCSLPRLSSSRAYHFGRRTVIGRRTAHRELYQLPHEDRSSIASFAGLAIALDPLVCQAKTAPKRPDRKVTDASGCDGSRTEAYTFG